MSDDAVFWLDGKVAVVTGGGGGIGRAVAQVLARAGAAVVVGDLDEERGEETVAGIARERGQARFRRTDVARRAELDALVATAVEAYGGLDIMCNVAGAPPAIREIADITESDLDAELAVSLKGVLYGCQAAAAAMRPGGAIVNTASTVVDIPAAGYGLYQIGKLAVVALTRTLALELGPKGIRVNAIAPGVTLTGFSARYFTAEDGTVDEQRRTEWLERMAAHSPLGMVGAPEDQALLVLYLASDAARFVTGQVIRANGGWSMP